MPELPEVETTVNGIKSHICNLKVQQVIIRETRLRWPIPSQLEKILISHTVLTVTRRAKYILIHFQHGTLIIHLGMSGNLRILKHDSDIKKHDHLDIVFNNFYCLRFHDPRRFGCVLWCADDITQHKLLRHLGPEPLEPAFNTNHLYERSRNRKISVKQFLMDSKIVVGVGNIYASESLFLAGIHPTRAAGRISKARYQNLSRAIKKVLTAAIKQGGTSLRDFTQTDGQPGYFKQKLNVYDRNGLKCKKCCYFIKHITQNNRSSYYCSNCQH